MRRDQLAKYGINTVLCLAVRGVHPRWYLRKVGGPDDPITTQDEREADYYVRDVDAAEMCRRVEWLTDLPFEVVTRPAVLGSPDRLPLAPAQTMRLASDVARHAAHFRPSEITEAAAHAAIEETFYVPLEDGDEPVFDDFPALLPSSGPGHACEAVAAEAVDRG